MGLAFVSFVSFVSKRLRSESDRIEGHETRCRAVRALPRRAGGAAHLPGMIAAHTVVPVIGVPVQTAALNGIDSLLSIVQMPRGVPVATVAIGASGAANAGLLAIAILATSRPDLRTKLQAYRDELAAEVRRSVIAD